MSNKSGKLSEADITARLGALNGWTYRSGKLHRDFQFADFIHAFAFMSGAALVAQSMDHHPEWSNVYNKIAVDLSTHDAGGVTEMDFALAEKMEGLAKKF